MQNTIATLNGNTNGTWSAGISNPAVAIIASPSNFTTTVSGLTALGKYTFVFTNANGCTDTLAVTVVSSTMSIPDIITPNGDGKNDLFQIKGLSFYPGSQLLIFNRWGNEVYRSDNYQNNWGGSGLADGTYFYVLNRKETSGGTNTFKGWIYLKR
jgi:gliding motility-associated-like protein